MPSRLFRGLCVLVAVILIGAMCASALSEGVQVFVYAYTLKVYEKPSKKSELLAVVPFARPLRWLAEKKGWAQVVTPDDQTGYCNAKQLTQSDPNTYDVPVYAQQNRAPVYQWPSVDAPMTGHLNRNDRVKMVAMTPKGDWLRIQSGSLDGYIQKPRVDEKKFASGKKSWTTEETAVYYDPDIDSIIGTMKAGQQVGVVSVDGGWAKIRSGSGLIGYCRADALTSKKPG